MKRGPKNVRCAAAAPRPHKFAALRPCAAFSLLELLVVLVLVLVLTTMYWTSNSDSSQARQQKACQKNLQKLFIAMEIYANDHAGKFPELAAARTAEEPLDLLVPRYTVDTSVFICPGSQDPVLPAGESFLKGQISYAYYMGRRATDKPEVLMSDRQVDTNSKTAGQNVFSINGKPPGNNHAKHGGNFLFCDGHAEQSPARAPFSIVLTQGVVLLNPKMLNPK
jgi:prepilin-type N-terminal cleavage/methylation domain-containing protein/prepilin-type processing-associated H-X9-DG protein